MNSTRTMYRRVVEISNEYLGPASERFINRQIATHLKKQPEEINARDLRELLGWLRLTFAHLTDDTSLVDSYIGDLESLSTASVGKVETYDKGR